MSEPANILLHPVGSAGDVYPYIGLGLALKDRGHRVTLLTSGYFQETSERVGLDFVDTLSREQFLRLTGNPDLWHPIKGARTILHSVTPELLRNTYSLIAERYEPCKTVLLTSCIGFAGRLAHEKLGVPLISVDLQPVTLWSDYETPIMHGFWNWAPAWLKRIQYWVGERFFLDPHIMPTINPFRSELGLAPISKLTRWWHSPQCILCLFPEWYAPRQPDWPETVQFSQFPLWNENTDEPLPADVESFLAEGEPPIVFTPGSANQFGAEFFAASAAACQRLGKRGMLFSRFADHVPATLPNGVKHFEYAPFKRLLPRCAAISQHGGIGTTSQAMEAGIPQLIMPLSHDQPDNAHRVKRLGVGDFLHPKHYTSERVAQKLNALLTDPKVPSACQDVQRRFSGVDPFSEACDVVESMVGADSH